MQSTQSLLQYLFPRITVILCLYGYKSLNCSQPSGVIETMVSPNRVCCKAEGSGEGKELEKRNVGKFLAFQIW